jgi:hypothetical protein
LTWLTLAPQALNFAYEDRQKHGPLLKSIIGMVFLGTPAGRNTMTRTELGGILHELSMRVSPGSIDSQPRRDKELLGKCVHDISFKFEQKWLSAATDVLSVSDKVSIVALFAQSKDILSLCPVLAACARPCPRLLVQMFLTLLFPCVLLSL